MVKIIDRHKVLKNLEERIILLQSIGRINEDDKDAYVYAVWNHAEEVFDYYFPEDTFVYEYEKTDYRISRAFELSMESIYDSDRSIETKKKEIAETILSEKTFKLYNWKDKSFKYWLKERNKLKNDAIVLLTYIFLRVMEDSKEEPYMVELKKEQEKE